MSKWVALFLAMAPLAAQVPQGWNQRTILGSDSAGKGWWYGAGLWAGDHSGPQATLTDSLGLGNAISGKGVHLEVGYRIGRWDMAAELLTNRTPQGTDYATLYRSHLWYKGRSGWQGGFEQEPLVWGYGLNGGYLLGEAARPFPRLRVESPMGELNAGPVPLGQWGWQAFMGRMDNHPVLGSEVQDPSWRSRAIASQGTPEAPLLMGYRVQAQFGPLIEFYMDMTNQWAGTLNGKGMTDGYNLGEYLTAMSGLKDTLAEANTNFSDPGHQATPYKNGARSASNADAGLRLKVPSLARVLKADTVQLYVSRGTNGVIWPIGLFLKHPAHYMGEEVRSDVSNAVTSPNYGAIWAGMNRYALPTMVVPNNAVGILATWARVRAGLEYYDGADNAGQGHRTFLNGQYLMGNYYYGDPLGNAVGGEAITTTAKVEADVTPRLKTGTKLIRGSRPFRDNLPDWQLDHPGQTAAKNRFTALEQTLDWKATAITTLSLGAIWQRQQAVMNMAGAEGNGCSWFMDCTFRWPAKS